MKPTVRTIRLVATEQAHPTRRSAATDTQVVHLTIAPDKLLLTVVEAAHRLGISRSLMYELIAAGEIETIHIGRLCKIAARTVEAFVERRNTPAAEPASQATES